MIIAAAYSLITKIATKIELKMATQNIDYNEALTQAVEEVSSNIKRIIITETQDAFIKAVVDKYKDEKGHYIWNAILDSRCCDECASLHGKVFYDHALIPGTIHPRCRCFVEFIKK